MALACDDAAIVLRKKKVTVTVYGFTRTEFDISVIVRFKHGKQNACHALGGLNSLFGDLLSYHFSPFSPPSEDGLYFPNPQKLLSHGFALLFFSSPVLL